MANVKPMCLFANVILIMSTFSVEAVRFRRSFRWPKCLRPHSEYESTGESAPTLTKQRVKDLFFETLPEGQYEIKDIENDIQLLDVPHQTRKYEVNLETKCLQLGKTRDEVETFLWHGAPYDALQTIIRNGFDRSWTKTRQYGVGNYFARDSFYSVMGDEPYAVVNPADGWRYILLCKVIVGESTTGKANPSTIPLKDDKTEYDTLLGTERRSTGPGVQVYVSYRDFMAIPMYLIKFKDVNDPVVD